MEFTQEFITEHKLEDAQISAIKELATSHISTLKGEWDGLANKNAEAIIDGAAKKYSGLTGVQRETGEKFADYAERAWNVFSESKSNELKTKIAEYDEKIKGAGTDEALKNELIQIKNSYSELQKKEAQFDELNGSGITDKYNTLKEENSTLKLNVAFNSVKPNFPETVNKYESNAKWNEFKKEILKENTLELVDGEWLVINKENKHKQQAKLSDLVGKDAEITRLMEGRQQKGTGGKEITLTKIDGVPFDIPVDASSSEISKLIKDHLLSKGISVTSDSFSKEFADLHKVIKNPKVSA
jgi:hypothetical protein